MRSLRLHLNTTTIRDNLLTLQREKAWLGLLIAAAVHSLISLPRQHLFSLSIEVNASASVAILEAAVAVLSIQ